MKPALRIVAVAEAVSFLLLVVGVMFKYGPPDNETGVKVMGPVHGTLFVVFVLLTVVVAADERWRLTRTLLTLLCAVVPLGGFIADRKLIDQERGEGRPSPRPPPNATHPG